MTAEQKHLVVDNLIINIFGDDYLLTLASEDELVFDKVVSFDSPTYCAFNKSPEDRDCNTCSMSHYFHDCNGNPIK